MKSYVVDFTWNPFQFVWGKTNLVKADRYPMRKIKLPFINITVLDHGTQRHFVGVLRTIENFRESKFREIERHVKEKEGKEKWTDAEREIFMENLYVDLAIVSSSGAAGIIRTLVEVNTEKSMRWTREENETKGAEIKRLRKSLDSKTATVHSLSELLQMAYDGQLPNVVNGEDTLKVLRKIVDEVESETPDLKITSSKGEHRCTKEVK